MPPEITDECIVCWKCIDICPDNAVSEADIQVTPKYSVPGVKISPEECADCGLCIDVCPVDAIIES